MLKAALFFHSNLFVLKKIIQVMPLVSSHASQPRDGRLGHAPLRPATAAEPRARRLRPSVPLAASQSGSSVRCGASLICHSRAQRHRSRRKRRAFLWGARSANGRLRLTLAPAERWAAPETAIQHAVPASAVTYASLAPVIDYVVPTPEATLDPIPAVTPHAEPDTAIQHVVPVPAVTVTIACPSDRVPLRRKDS